jgi:hypothetical protein
VYAIKNNYSAIKEYLYEKRLKGDYCSPTTAPGSPAVFMPAPIPTLIKLSKAHTTVCTNTKTV